jgi:hypothetical protein
MCVERSIGAFWFRHAYKGDLGGVGAASVATFVPVSGHRSPVIWLVNVGGLPNRRLRRLPAPRSADFLGELDGGLVGTGPGSQVRRRYRHSLRLAAARSGRRP